MSAVLALTALGLSLVFGVMRVVNVAHGEFFMLGAVLAWWASTAWSSAILRWASCSRWWISPLGRRRDRRLLAERLVLSPAKLQS